MAKAKQSEKEPMVTIRPTLKNPGAHLFTSAGKVCAGETVEVPEAEAEAAVEIGAAEIVTTKAAETPPSPTNTDEAADATGDN